MTTYTIKPEFLDKWSAGFEILPPDLTITEEELKRLAREWNMYVEDLIEQLIKEEVKD